MCLCARERIGRQLWLARFRRLFGARDAGVIRIFAWPSSH